MLCTKFAEFYRHTSFSILLSPQVSCTVAVPDDVHPVIKSMADSAQACGVGPMAAVAGAVAQFVAEALLPFSSNVIVENGGDIYMHSTRPRKNRSALRA